LQYLHVVVGKKLSNGALFRFMAKIVNEGLTLI